MKITGLEVSGFRAFGGRYEFDFDADAILFAGQNGQGKTSLFDAILWALSGTIPRLGDPAPVVSMFGDAGEARVSLRLRSSDGSDFNVVRSSDGKESVLSVEADGIALRGPEATSKLLRAVWPQALNAERPAESLAAALLRGVYLQQDRVRDFLEAETEQDRFATVSELIGAGRINELQIALDRSKRAWSQAKNARSKEIEELRERLNDLQARVAGLASGDDDVLDPRRWEEWWARSASLGIRPGDAPAIDAPDAAARLDAAVAEIAARRQAEARRRDEAVALRAALEEFPDPPAHDLDVLRERAASARAAHEGSQVLLTEAERRASEIRRLQVEAEQAREQLRAFAQLALQHLGERCPVCLQTYDREGARERLEAIVAGAPGEEPALEMPDVNQLASLVNQHARDASVALNAVAAAERQVTETAARRVELERRLSQLGQGLDWTSLGGIIDAMDGSLAALERHERDGDVLALALARAGQQARRAEVERESTAVQHAVARGEAELAARERTGVVAAELIDALRTASSDVVESELVRIEPLLQRIYATADPHPAFRVVRLISRMRSGRGRVVSQIEDPVRDVPSDTPRAVLSSSQMNVLAVSIFLALNLGMQKLPLEAAMLDDPLQSLDDLNLLGLTDLLRRTRERRQLFLSTHDPRFAGLLERKLRPVTDNQRTLVYALEAWTPEGVEISMREVDRDANPVKLAAA